MKSLQNGLWSDPATWGGKIPASADNLIISHEVELDIDSSISGATVTPEGCLMFKEDKSVTLQSSKNIVILGCFEMQPANSKIIHLLRFINIDESKFVGGGMEVLDTDIGLWVMDNGMVTFEGTEKMGWTRSGFPIPSGATSFAVEDAKGWEASDEIVIMPTAPNAINYDERVIKSLQGNIITLNSAATAHPQITGYPTAEVINLTRNVRIEGTMSGHSHIFICSMMKQEITAVAIRYMGPRKTQQGMANSLVSGRYGLHFHHCEDGSRGNVVDCVVIRDCASHCFVAHSSHGITFEQCATYNSIGDAYWYDLQEPTHDLTYDECIAALINFIPRSLDMDLWAIDKSDKVPDLGANGWLLGRGDNNTIKDCVVVGSSGDPHAKGGFLWPTRDENNPEGVWNVLRILAHNCNCGFLTWQNTTLNHTINQFSGYSNGQDGFLGAYQNGYELRDCVCNGLFEVKAASAGLRFINCKFGTLRMIGSPLDSIQPLFFLNCSWDKWEDAVGESVHNADIINCTGPISVTGLSTEVVRVQLKGGQAYKLTKSGKVNISNFAPTIWGEGTGLRGEYFSDPNFKNKVFERVDSIIAFADWNNWVHHLLTKAFSVRWTGKLLAQFTEAYSFGLTGGGNMKLFLNDKQVTGKINLTAGAFYSVRLEFFNNDSDVRGGANFSWSSSSLNILSPGGEIIPQLQLYPDAVVVPPVNKPPTANAGTDITIQLPLSSVILNGSGSDSDGVIMAYKWTGKGTIAAPDKPVTQVSGLVEGDYVYTLTVTDDKGATASDTVTVHVLAAEVNQPPVISADIQVVRKGDIYLNGTGTDPEGKPLTWKWTQKSGAAVVIKNSDQQRALVENALQGSYVFVESVSDGVNTVVKEWPVTI